jgi:hypothetical protein
VIWSILLKRVWMLSVTLSWLPVAPEATKVSVVPLMVMVSPAAKSVAPAAPLLAGVLAQGLGARTAILAYAAFFAAVAVGASLRSSEWRA